MGSENVLAKSKIKLSNFQPGKQKETNNPVNKKLYESQSILFTIKSIATFEISEITSSLP